MRVDDVRGKSGVADFLQTSYQELKIDDGRDHAEKAPAGENWFADENNRARGLAAIDNQSLPVIGAAFARRSETALQFSTKKGVGGDASGRDALGFGIQYSGVGNVVGGGNEVFE